MKKFTLLLIAVLGSVFPARSQFLMDLIDTTTQTGKGLLDIVRRYDHIRIGGYMQPQYQVASRPGMKNYSGGDFSPFSDNRFMLRRGRIRFDYLAYDDNYHPTVQFVFQFDGTERGVNIRDFWGRFWENKMHLFSVTTGMFARPFGYEINLSSGDREVPERGRMSQTLMRTERDLGAMASVERRVKQHNFLDQVKFDIGIFNGQGLTGPVEFDGYKDLISQVYVKPVAIAKNLYASGGASILYGGIRQVVSRRYYTVTDQNGLPAIRPDSSYAIGSKSPRTYGGVNAQLKWKHSWGATELRGEYWQGTQTATEASSETPGNLIPPEPFYVRNFNGGFFHFIQDVVNSKNQLLVKYDWYDPNTRVKGTEIGRPGANINAANIAYRTWGVGFLRHLNANLKLVLYYEFIHNEATLLPGYDEDLNDQILTCRLQYRF